MTRRFTHLLLLVAALFVVAPSTLGGCSAAPQDDSDSSDSALGMVDEFPPRASVEYAMDQYLRDPQAERAHAPMSLDEYFKTEVRSANGNHLRIEVLKPNPRVSSQPIAFLHSSFYGGDMYWDDRYKDVQLYHLADSTGTRSSPFPEAAHIPSEGAVIVRLWTAFQPIKKGPPPGLDGDALLNELARLAVWSYVSGNVDGIASDTASNGGNGGFSKFRDASGREFWRGVLIDEGAAWNDPPESHKPWNTNLLGKGPVAREQIPEDVVNSMMQLARSSPNDLAKASRFDKIDDGAIKAVTGIQARARVVLDHYGIKWQTAQVIPMRRRDARDQMPVRRAA